MGELKKTIHGELRRRSSRLPRSRAHQAPVEHQQKLKPRRSSSSRCTTSWRCGSSPKRQGLRRASASSSNWSPAGRIKDSSRCRAQGYQSRTPRLSARTVPFEVQTGRSRCTAARRGRRRAMEVQGRRAGTQRESGTFQWMRQLLDIQKEVRDPGVIQNLKVELYQEKCTRSTPKGSSRRSCAARRRSISRTRSTPTWAINRRPRASTQDGAAAHAAAERRHRRDHHAGGAQAEPRLAEFGRDRARALRDQALDRREEKTHAIELAEAVREGSAALRPEPQDAPRRRRVRKALSGRRRAEADDFFGPSATASCNRSRFLARWSRRQAARETARGRVPLCPAVLGPATKIKFRGFDDLMVFARGAAARPEVRKSSGYITRGKGCRHSATFRTSSPPLRPGAAHRRRVDKTDAVARYT